MSIESEPDVEVSPRADLWSALVWVAFGAVVGVASWRMDRLENLHINKYEIPGLVPGLLGAAIVLLGVLLALRSIARGALRMAPQASTEKRGSRIYTGIVLGAMLLYSVVLVGHGLPFWLVTAVFVSAFIFFFDRGRQAECEIFLDDVISGGRSYDQRAAGCRAIPIGQLQFLHEGLSGGRRQLIEIGSCDQLGADDPETKGLGDDRHALGRRAGDP